MLALGITIIALAVAWTVNLLATAAVASAERRTGGAL